MVDRQNVYKYTKHKTDFERGLPSLVFKSLFGDGDRGFDK